MEFLNINNENSSVGISAGEFLSAEIKLCLL